MPTIPQCYQIAKEILSEQTTFYNNNTRNISINDAKSTKYSAKKKNGAAILIHS